MDFGQWIRSIRKEQQLDIRALAIRTGVEASTISRVENTRTQVTLSTAIRICEGLGVTAIGLIQAIQGKQLLLTEDTSLPPNDAIPTLHDVESFIISYRTNPREGYLLLSNILNKVLSLRDIDIELSKRDNTYPFTPEGVRSLLFHSTVYQFEIQYPSDIEPKDILAIYKQGGVLTLVDIGIYIKKVRRQKQVTLAHLEDTAKVSTSVLSRLETGSMEQVKLADTLKLDEQLEQGGKLLAMYWRAHQLNTAILHLPDTPRKLVESLSLPRPEFEEKLLSAFITLHRWLLHVPNATYETV